MAERKYDTTLARIAGNIASGMYASSDDSMVRLSDQKIVVASVNLARAIVAEVIRTEPVEHTGP